MIWYGIIWVWYDEMWSGMKSDIIWSWETEMMYDDMKLYDIIKYDVIWYGMILWWEKEMTWYDRT